MFINSRSSHENYTCFRPKGAKTLPDGVVHTYIAYIAEYPQVSSPGVGGYSREFLVGVCRQVLQILTRFQT